MYIIEAESVVTLSALLCVAVDPLGGPPWTFLKLGSSQVESQSAALQES